MGRLLSVSQRCAAGLDQRHPVVDRQLAAQSRRVFD
jgi:hypothetical protein